MEQSEYRRAQRDAIHGIDLVDKDVPTARDCARSARLIERARDDYGHLRIRMDAIEPPTSLQGAHQKLVRSLQVYSRYFDQLHQVLAFCDVAQLTAASTSQLPLRAQGLRAQWRVAVLDAGAKSGVQVPHWTREVGRPSR